jgi:phage/plasmid-like protein (TIGR03299 family)
MFSVKTVPWHNEGNIIQDSPSFETALKIAEIDYEVKTLPLMVMVTDTLSIDSPMGQAVVRMDRLPSQKSILGIVGDGYTPLQNREAFEILEPLIDKGLLELQTGGVLRGGADAWLLGKLTIKDKLVEEVFGDKTIPYILISNNHNGRQPVTAMYTPIEVVCANTLSMAHHGRNRSNSTVIKKHTKSIRLSFIEAAMVFFEDTMDSYHLIAEDYKLLKERILSVEEFTKHVLDVVSPIPVIEKDDKTSHSDSVIDRANGKRDILSQAWENATGNRGDHSAWEAYMAVTELLDYSDSLVKVKKNGSRLQSMINGPIGNAKQEVVDSLVTLARN